MPKEEYAQLPKEPEPYTPPCSVMVVVFGFVLVTIAIFAFATQFINNIP